MGSDLIVYAEAIELGVEPDWAAGTRAISKQANAIIAAAKDDAYHYDLHFSDAEDDDDIISLLQGDWEDFKNSIEGPWRNVVRLDFKGYVLFIFGYESEMPMGGEQSWERVQAFLKPALDAAGFITDWDNR